MVYVNGIYEEKCLTGAAKDCLFIKVDHIDADIIQNDAKIEDAIKSAVDAGVYGGDVSLSQVSNIITNGRDNKETETQFALFIWKQKATEESLFRQVCVLLIH